MFDKAKVKTDNTLFKKLTSYVWEFRTLFNKRQYRLFAFWDKSDNKVTIVIATHGIIKKTQKTPKKEIDKATESMNNILNQKTRSNETSMSKIQTHNEMIIWMLHACAEPSRSTCAEPSRKYDH